MGDRKAPGLFQRKGAASQRSRGRRGVARGFSTWAESVLKDEKSRDTRTHLGPRRRSPASYRELRPRSRRDRCCRHLPGCPVDPAAPERAGSPAVLPNPEPPAEGDPKPGPRWKGLLAPGLETPTAHPHRDAHAESERTRKRPHALTGVCNSQSKRRASSGNQSESASSTGGVTR